MLGLAPVKKLPEAGTVALAPPAKPHEAVGSSLYEPGRLLAASALSANITGGTGCGPEAAAMHVIGM